MPSHDITFCAASCLTADCPRNTYVRDLHFVNEWISMADFSNDCPEYEPDDAGREDDLVELDFEDYD